ncbi:hypothetical protein LSUB1_G006825 [Lachnellula subtilissima]|uniref:Rhodopsin domain-containing protein n=1 Tax=Lachnellula subtilissima TaxID=602034 RepID=A0A8H8RHG4_9HELO|nr:hypothetical protein LSUB1_G006825 [Lachnellula subtilissima]
MTYTIELWTEYGIGMLVFATRFFARYKTVGLRGFAWDDLFSFIAMLLWCSDAITFQIINSFGSFVGLNDQTAEALSNHTAARYKVGSQALFCAWISYVSLIWSLKASLLFFYSRLTLGLWQTKLVKVMAYISFVAYIAVMLELFVHCTPIQKNWQIKPYPGDKCAVTVSSYVLCAILNVSTDIGILAIPLPIVWKVKIPMRRKIVIGLLLSSGIFVITAAILRCVLTLAESSHIGVSTIWALRETFVSLIAISAPAIKPLFNKNSWIGSASSKNGASSGRFKKFGGSKLSGVTGNQTMIGDGGKDLELGSSRKGPHSMESEMELNDISHNGSEENIINSGTHNSPLEINVTTAYVLKNEEKDDSPTRVLSQEARDGRESAAAHPGPERELTTDRWGSSTQVTTGERAERSNNKAMKMLGGGWS